MRGGGQTVGYEGRMDILGVVVRYVLVTSEDVPHP